MNNNEMHSLASKSKNQLINIIYQIQFVSLYFLNNREFNGGKVIQSIRALENVRIKEFKVLFNKSHNSS